MLGIVRCISRITVTCLLVIANPVFGDDAPAAATRGQFTFAWPYLTGDTMAPRGGTTVGERVNLRSSPAPSWAGLSEPGLTPKERDRRAILAMTGPYRASFDFIETAGFTQDYEPDAPYQSWGTEYIYVVADEEDFISLQHIMVIRFAGTDGESGGAMVVKHWRQDWRYQAAEYHVYAGHQQWRKNTLSTAESKGQWVQSVYQVDDSLRYAAAGRWEHQANYASWTSEKNVAASTAKRV